MVVRGWIRRRRRVSSAGVAEAADAGSADAITDARTVSVRPAAISRPPAFAHAQRREAELRRAVEARDEFVAVASHELRTPLAALQLQLDNALREARRAERGGPPFVAQLEAAQRQVGRLSRMVEQLLDVSQIAAGRLSLELERVDLSDLVRDVLERMRDPLARAGCSVTVEQHGTAVGLWDRLRLEQVVTNLLANASKYGAGKPIEVRVEAESGRARLSVVDHGIGIDDADQERIFDRFERAVSTRHYGGLGLGLFIVGRILAALGGRIRVESRLGQGATFVVELDCVDASEPPST